MTRASVLNGRGHSVYVGGAWNVVDAAKPVIQRLLADAMWKKTGALNVEMTILPDGKLLAGGSRFFTGIGPATVAVEVSFTRTPDGLTLAWPTGYQPQRTTTLTPPDWQALANPSPFTVPLGGPGEFFRVVPAP